MKDWVGSGWTGRWDHNCLISFPALEVVNKVTKRLKGRLFEICFMKEGRQEEISTCFPLMDADGERITLFSNNECHKL